MSAPDPDLMSYVVRMVIPIKREFGRSVDVHQFLHDLPYAREVIELALSSNDLRLNSYAEYVQTKMFGARGTNSAVAPVAPPPATGATSNVSPQAPDPNAPPDNTSKNAAMEKYKTRLR